MAFTKLKKLTIEKFRALENVSFELGSHITVICGKNGTSKSSILGIAAQIFSFEKDYASETELDYKTITGDNFKSNPAEHFRFSAKFDLPGSLEVKFDLHDGYTEQDTSAELKLIRRRSINGRVTNPRPVVRHNVTIEGINTSRNFTHPVIYLSLQRLNPIAMRIKYIAKDFEYLSEKSEDFIALNNELLNKRSTNSTGTDGSMKSAVAYGENYDQDSVSAGEDNAGQIILALMSFRKLKKDYRDYKGGLLLIDEADAGLFPAAQIKLVDILHRECNELNIQVIMTSHSPTLIEHTYELSQKFRRKFKTVYLSDTYGKVQSLEDQSWLDIHSDLLTQTVKVNAETTLPKVNVYFEDREGFDLLSALLHRNKAKKLINPLDSVSMGCSNYIQLIQKGIPEFAKRSLIVLDGDVKGTENLPSVVLLPTSLPPDQLLFEYLYNLDAGDDFWRNEINFTKPVFDNSTRDIVRLLKIRGANIALKDFIEAYYGGDEKPKREELRKVFKAFYKSKDLQAILTSRTNAHHPWRKWVADNPRKSIKFKEKFLGKLSQTLQYGFGVESSKLADIKDY